MTRVARISRSLPSVSAPILRQWLGRASGLRARWPDTADASARSVSTALKPPMASGLFRCVGCTTDKEYARFIAGDEAMNSRFRKIILPEPDRETAIKIIEGSKANLVRGRAR